MSKAMNVTLKDDTRNESVDVRFEHDCESVLIFAKGYGVKILDEGTDFIAALEFCEGRLRLLVWDNDEDEPSHTISLEGAKNLS